ncbi:hypothetical protein Q9233_003479 [Columba guinea]|nr:hypothetical protein Q9233_003479 [Columba guinea]
MVCTRKTKTLVSTCVILSGMTNIVCLLYVGWVTNYIASVYVKVQEPISEKKLEEDKGDTLRIIERLDHLENVIKQHIQVWKKRKRKAQRIRTLDFSGKQILAVTGSANTPTAALDVILLFSDISRQFHFSFLLYEEFSRSKTRNPKILVVQVWGDPVSQAAGELFKRLSDIDENLAFRAQKSFLMEYHDRMYSSKCLVLSGDDLFSYNHILLKISWYFKVKYLNQKIDHRRRQRCGLVEQKHFVMTQILQNVYPEAPPKPEENPAEAFTDSSLFAHWGQDLSPENRRIALKQFQYYGYNAYLSDRLPLDRPLPDLRPNGCRNLTFPDRLPEVSIVFIFVNEALSVILRSIHSAIDRTPAHLLKEIILVDDNSNNALSLASLPCRSKLDSYRPLYPIMYAEDLVIGIHLERIDV